MTATNTGARAMPSPISTAELLRSALWFGAISGFAQVLIMQGGIHLFHQTVTLGPNMFWMTPLAMMLCLLGVGLLVAAVRKLSPKLSGQRASSAVMPFAFLAFLNLELFIPHVHLVADFLIAAGLATVTARLINRYETAFRRLIGKTVVPLSALVLLLAVGILTVSWRRERMALGRLPASARGAPNVLLLVFDTARRKSLSLYGYDRPTTPQLIRWAQRGVVFQHAVSPAPWTLPSHATMFTGHWPHELSADWNSALDDSPTTLAEFLDSRGYATGGFVANLSYASRVHGLSRGFVHYDDFPLSLAELFVSAKLTRDFLNHAWLRRIIGFHDVLGRKNAREVGSRFLRWTERQEPGRPFFAFLNFFDAHEPYMPPREFDRRFAGPVSRNRGAIEFLLHQGTMDWQGKMSPADLGRERDAYDAAIAFMDSTVGGLLDDLDGRGLLDSTVIIITADHGEHFGEHGKYSHGNTLYRPLLEVPLLMIYPPRIHSGSTVSRTVSLRDIPQTLIDLIGVRDSAPFPGHSLVPLIQNEADSASVSPAISELTLAGGPRAVSLFQDSLHLIYWKGKDMMYDWRADGDESRDIAADTAMRSTLARMRTLLASTGSVPPTRDTTSPERRSVSAKPGAPRDH